MRGVYFSIVLIIAGAAIAVASVVFHASCPAAFWTLFSIGTVAFVSGFYLLKIFVDKKTFVAIVEEGGKEVMTTSRTERCPKCGAWLKW